jgi:hypothetical protein
MSPSVDNFLLCDGSRVCRSLVVDKKVCVCVVFAGRMTGTNIIELFAQAA